MKIIKEWFARPARSAERPAPRVAESPLMLALEPRVVYDASVAAVAAQPHAHDPAHTDSHSATETHTDTSVRTSGNATASAPPDQSASAATNAASDARTDGASAPDKSQTGAAQNDVPSAVHATQITQTQVVFIDPSVANYQVLVAGLPAGTQYVVLDANTDGLAQIAQYLQAHHGVESISLISHGSDGMIQVGSTWLTNSDFSGYSTQLAQIGAAMKAGGDFLIYGCDVAQQADGQALVQKIAALTHLNVAASTDATGSAALGGNWTLEYQVGNVHTTLNESVSAQAQFNELLGVTTETYDSAAANNFASIGQSQFTLDGLVYTLDQPANTYAYNASNWPSPSDISVSPTDGVLEINADGASTMHDVTISLANGHTFSLQSFDLSSFNGDLYIQANYANGSKSALIQLATAAVGGFEGSVSNQNQLGTAFNNIVSFSLIDQNDTGSFEPTLNNLAYIDNGPSVTTSGGSAAWASSDNGVGGTAVAVDPGITISDPGSASAATATVRITNVQSGDQLSFVAQNGITGSYDGATGILLLTGSGSPSIANWQAALQSVTFFSTQASPTLSTTTRTVSFSFNDGTEASNVATRSITITATDQTPLVTEGGASSTGYIAGSAAVAIDANLHVSDADTPKLSSGTVAIASGYASGDTLSFSNTSATLYGDIVGSYNSSTQKLTLTSVSNNATVAQWQNVFDAITFSSAAGTTGGTRDITFSVSDGSKTSALLHHSVVVTTGPKLTTDAGSAAFVSGDNTTSTPVAVDSGILLADGNSTTLASATVAITGNFQVNHDELVFVGNPATMGDISAVYDSGTGVLTLTSAGGASLLQWQNALGAIQFTNDLVVPSTLTRTVSFQISDGTLTSAVATRTVTVTATDQTPVLGAGGNTTAFVAGDNVASTPVTVNNAITVSDLDGGPLQQAVVTLTSHYEPTDVLAFTNTSAALYGNIAASYTGGVLTLTSSGNAATLAQWQNALQAVTYSSTAITPGTGARTVSFVVNDGTKLSAAVTSTVTVADTDQTPVIGGSSGSVTFTQGDNVPSTPIVIDAGITLSDRDNSTLTQANVVIASGYDSIGDTLLFANDGSTMGNITGTYSSGVLVLTSTGGSATLAQWQSALRSIRFTDSAATPGTTQRAINFVVTDGVKVSAPFQRAIDVVRTDQTPIVTNSGGSTTFTSADNAPSTPIVVDASVTLTDSDSPTLASATVAITGNFQSGEDVLTLGSGSFGDIQAHFDAGTGTLALTSAGSASLAQWQAALRSITYTDTAAVPQTANRVITFIANDGTKSSASSSKVIVVDATHQTPVLGASGSSLNYLPGQAATSIDSGITLTDLNVSGSTLVSMSITARISAGMQSGDTLGFGLPTSTLTNGMTVTFDGTSGTLTITSTGGTLAQWQTVLDNLQFSAPVNAALGARTISITISDGVKTSTALDYSVNVISSAPALASASAGSVSFVAGDNSAALPVAIDPNLTVSDPLGNVVDSAVVSITGNLYAGEDVLSFANDGLTMGNITGSYNPSTGVLTLSSSGGSATLGQWQAALRTVAYTDTSVTPNSATRTVSFSLNAGPQSSNVLTRAITVSPTDQTPQLSSGSTGSAAFVAGDNTVSTPVAIDTNIVVSDLDNTTLSSATVQLGAGFHQGEDVLGFINNVATMGNITASYDAAHGVLTLTSSGASATLAQWQAALRAVTYTDTAITPTSVSRTVSFTVSDGTKSSAPITRTVSVADTDQTPIVHSTSSGAAVFTSAETGPSTPIAVDTGIVLSDLDNTTLASATVQIGTGFHAGEDVLGFRNDGSMGNITGAYNASTGTLTLSSAGTTATVAQWQAALRAVTYTDTAVKPDKATRSIGFSVNDGTQSSLSLSRDVSVTTIHQTPLLSADNTALRYTADGKPASSVSVGTGITLIDRNDTPPTSATVAISGGFDPAHDVLSFAPGAATGDIAANYDAASGVLTLRSAGGTATLAQWQTAIQAVAYRDTQISNKDGTRTLTFVVSDATASSAPLTRTLQISAGQDPVGSPILPKPQPGPVGVPNVVAPPAVSDHRNPLILSDLNGQNDAVSNPAIVLNALGNTGGIGSVSPRTTFTFAVHGANDTSLGNTHVSALDSIVAHDPQITPPPPPRTLPAADVSPVRQPGNGFALSIAPLLQAPTSAPGAGAHDNQVAITLADGAPLPPWLHFDSARDVLTGTPPAGVHSVQVTLLVRDAAGNLTRREVTLHFDATVDRATNGTNPQGRNVAPAPGHAALPAAKASLAAQFANAHAALHVATPAEGSLGPARSRA